MATRYGYSRTFKAPGSDSTETFSVESANSFDEAQKVVNKGVYDRELEIKQQLEKPVQTTGFVSDPNSTSSASIGHGGNGPAFPGQQAS